MDVEFVGSVLSIIFLTIIFFGLILFVILLIRYSMITDDKRQEYINSLDEHDKSVIAGYKNCYCRTKDLFKFKK